MNEIRIKPCQPARSRPVKSCGGWQRKTRFPPPAPLPTTPPFSRQPYPSFWPKRNKQLKNTINRHTHTLTYIYIYIRAWTFSLTCITHSATLKIYYPYIYLLFTFTALYRLFLFFSLTFLTPKCTDRGHQRSRPKWLSWEAKASPNQSALPSALTQVSKCRFRRWQDFVGSTVHLKDILAQLDFDYRCFVYDKKAVWYIEEERGAVPFAWERYSYSRYECVCL